MNFVHPSSFKTLTFHIHYLDQCTVLSRLRRVWIWRPHTVPIKLHPNEPQSISVHRLSLPYLPFMASKQTSKTPKLLTFIFLAATLASAQLSSTFYDKSCPSALRIIQSTVSEAVSKERRMGASLLRLHFHDCFVNVLYLNWWTFVTQTLLSSPCF